MDNNVILMGFSRGKDALLICNEKGLDMLPCPMRIEKGEGWYEPDGTISNSFYVWIKANKSNVIALLLGGWITVNDANKILRA